MAANLKSIAIIYLLGKIITSNVTIVHKRIHCCFVIDHEFGGKSYFHCLVNNVLLENEPYSVNDTGQGEQFMFVWDSCS